jgi:hypothetical protein
MNPTAASLEKVNARGGRSIRFREVTRRQVGILVAIAGVLACVLVALADPLGLGHDGLGPKKDALLAIGGLLILAGLVLALRSRRSEPLEEMRHMRG